MKAIVKLFALTSISIGVIGGLAASSLAADNSSASGADSSNNSNGNSNNSDQAPLSQAEIWVQQRAVPEFMQQNQEAKKRKTPVRSFLHTVAKGAAQELGTSMSDMGKDMILVFSVQDIDPYEKKGPPKNKEAVVMKMQMTDGSSAYLHHFPDNSFAVEDGFADGTVLVPAGGNEWTVKYPNNVQGKLVFQRNQILIYRPDKTITTFKKTASGSYDISNTKFGYMGTARSDDTD